jgi:uncharacterized protein (DUF58 family)
MLGPQPPSTEPPPLFSETFLRRLERVSLIVRRIRSGHNKGERRSHKRGSSVEFADYRNYSPGDDLRRLDWRVYARLERPFIKLFEEEEDQTIHLVADASGSMNWPEGEAELNKWNFSRKLAAALGYIALASGDRLTVSQLSQGRHDQWGPYRGRGQVHNLLHHLSSLVAGGPTDLNAALRHLALAKHRPGLLFLITDFFSPGGYEQGLAALGNAGYEINILHLLSPDEMEPDLLGDLRLHDVETGETQEVTLDPGLHWLYRQRFEAWRDAIESYCFSRNINYLTLSSSLVFENVMLGYLRQRGFVR